MAETVPKIRVTDPHSAVSRPFSASPLSPPDDQSIQWQIRAAQMSSSEPVSDSNSGQNSPVHPSIPRESNAPAAKYNAQTDNPAVKRPESNQSAVDPLSLYIAERTNFTTLSPTKSRQTVDEQNDPTSPQGLSATSDIRKSLDSGRGDAKDNKKKGVNFLSRIIGNKRKDSVTDIADRDSDEMDDDRLEGANAQVFGEAYHNIGFNPRHPQPPRYIKVRAFNKKEREFNRVFLAQELKDGDENSSADKTNGTSKRREKTIQDIDGNGIWAMQFSMDGKYLATTGQDKLIRIWAVISSPEQRRAHEKAEDISEDPEDENFRLSAPVFLSKPLQVLKGHEGPILDLSWSKNNFLLSSSMDKTVRLWHISRSECLCAFKHTDFVTSIKFHPKDDRFFLAGSLDCKLRLWSIPDKSVAFWTQTPDMITAVAFTPDGKSCIAGCLTGLCVFFETESLKYQTQMHVRSARGRNSKGSKITGIKTVLVPPSGELKLLITSNDSRIRLYNYRDKSLEVKFKGNENTSSQIHAALSDDGRYVICGSEDKKVYIWSMQTSLGDQKDKRPVEVFEAHSGITTVSLLAPAKTKRLLSASEDPIYDLCNPPPVTLVSKTVERPGSARSSLKAPSEVGSIQPTPAHLEGTFMRAEESPAYRSRATHANGNIIVTADSTGAIRVFRQDCAQDKRLGDAASLSSRVKAGIVRRQSSVASARSRHSMSATTGRDRRDSRILSWRQGVASNGSLNETKNPSPSLLQEALSRTRSSSPRKSQSLSSKGPPNSASLNGKTSSTGNTSYSSASAHKPLPRSATLPSPTQHSAPHHRFGSIIPSRKRGSLSTKAAAAPTSNPSTTIANGLTTSPTEMSPSDKAPRPNPLTHTAYAERTSQAYWEHEAWQSAMLQQFQNHFDAGNSHAHATHHDGDNTLHVDLPPNARRSSIASTVSKLSNEMDSSVEEDTSAYEDAPEAPSGNAPSGHTHTEVIQTSTPCRRCGGLSVRYLKASSSGSKPSEGKRPVCASCGTIIVK